MQTFDKMIRRVKKVLAFLILVVVIFISYFLVMYQLNSPIKTVGVTKMDMAKMDMTNMDINKNMLVAEKSQMKSKKTIYCENNTVSNYSPLVDHWQRVDTYGTAYVFSAYVAGPAQLEVFIIGALKDGEATAEDVLVVSAMGDERATFYCIYWLLGHYTETMFKADVVTVPKKEKASNSVVMFKCPLPASSTLPEAVSLVAPEKCISPRNFLAIQKEKTTNTSRNFTVCMPPHNFQTDREMKVIEWIELNRILGASHFVIYRFSKSQNMDKVLRLYSERGLAEVINWDLANLTFGLEQFGRVAALNHCYRRSRYKSSYIVVLNIDEYIIPKYLETITWGDMMKEIPRIKKGAFVFHASYFRTDWADSADVANMTNFANAKNYGLITLLKLLREDLILPPALETNYIVQSHRVEILGSNYVHAMTPGFSSTLVIPSTAFVHKYSSSKRHNLNRMLDASIAVKYGETLVEKIRDIWKDLSM